MSAISAPISGTSDRRPTIQIGDFPEHSFSSGTQIGDNRTANLGDNGNSSEATPKVRHKQDEKFWVGRFVALKDKYKTEKFHEDVKYRQMSDDDLRLFPNQLTPDEEMAKSIFLQLHQQCETEEARLSLWVRFSLNLP